MKQSPGSFLDTGAGGVARDAASRAGARDLSQPVYTPWRERNPTSALKETILPAELLQALPRVKGSPLTVTPSSDPAVATKLAVLVQADTKWNKSPSEVVYTDLTTSVTEGPKTLEGQIIFDVARIGLRVTGLKIDSAVAPALSRDPSSWRVAAATNRLLQALDTMIGQGIPGDVFNGLRDLAFGAGHLGDATSLTLEKAAANLLADVSTTGNGCGEGAHCLIGNNAVLKALMLTDTAKGNASCGWKHDPRTGLTVFHYLGVPFYRSNITASPEEGEYLFAANLGPAGLALVHAYGTAETCGLEVEQEPTNPALAARDLIVHGAYALVVWDPGAIFGYKKVSVT
jgi:hypothetical protein